jgi:hypothetical protein
LNTSFKAAVIHFSTPKNSAGGLKEVKGSTIFSLFGSLTRFRVSFQITILKNFLLDPAFYSVTAGQECQYVIKKALFDLKMMITYISVKLRVLCLNKTLYF